MHRVLKWQKRSLFCPDVDDSMKIESGAFSLRFLSVMPRIDEIELMDILIQSPSMVSFLDSDIRAISPN